MFGTLTSRYQTSVNGRFVNVLFENALSFFDDAGDTVAMFPARFLFERCERLLKPGNVALGFS
jgi:hypothetical protein